MEHDLLAQKRTAYALGEADAAERAVIEADLARSSAHRLEVEELRALATAVSGALANEKKPGLSEIQHLAIESTLQQMTEDHEALAAARLRRQRIAFWLPTALAACALLASGITLFILSSQQATTLVDAPSSPGEIAANGIGTAPATKPRINDLIKDYNQYVRIAAPTAVPASFGPHVDAVAAAEAESVRAFHPAAITPLSTFPLTVDVATFGYVKDILQRGALPPAQMVHVEAMINAYSYEDAAALEPEKPLAVKTEVSDCPWNAGHKLARVLVKAKGAAEAEAIVAEDVRVRVEFNPNRVSSYRLIGYENRAAAGADQRDEHADLKSGHVLTVLYEIVPVGNFGKPTGPGADVLKYQRAPQFTSAADSDELFTVVLKFRTDEDPIEQTVEAPAIDPGLRLANASEDFRFAAAVAQFGLVLLDSPSKGQGSLDAVRALAQDALGADVSGERASFLRLVEQAQTAVN